MATDINSKINLDMKKKITFVIISFLMFPAVSQSQIINYPDSVEMYISDTVLVDLLANAYHTNNDSIYVHLVLGGQGQLIDNQYLLLKPKSSWQGKRGRIDTIRYRIRSEPMGSLAWGELYITLINESYNVLDINNLSARFYAMGNHFWDFEGYSEFFAPKSTIKTPFFNSTFWIGGLEHTTGKIHLSAERYRQVGVDFYAGPVSAQYDSLYDRKWNRVWKLTTADIQHHIAAHVLPGYTPIRDIEEWPAHGDTTQGELWNIAPFYDSNNSGTYEPMEGDYPLIRGNMALFFVFNDIRRPNTESGGAPLGIEVHGMAYAFDQPNDSMLNNTIFMHYDIINRSSNRYDSTWLGIFNDFDLGYAWDDFIGTHVKHGAVYAYNGTPVDGSGQAWAYGANPPVIAMQMLAGAYMDPDGIDNPKTDSLGNPLCDVSLNGAGFGDGIPDNERLGLSRSIYFNNIGMYDYMRDPFSYPDYYNYLRGFYLDSTKMLYGGNGHITTGAYGPEANYIFPADSDPCHFGTGGLPPNGPVLWTESTAGNQPYDRRILASSGPFTYNPGDRQELDVAFIFAYDLVNNAPFDTLVDWMDRLKKLYLDHPEVFDPNISVAERPGKVRNKLVVYPNPAANQITITGISDTKKAHYQIFSLTGQMVGSGSVANGESLNISSLTSGMYILRIQTGSEVFSSKFIKE